jgi:hypothetical protein
MNKCDIKDYIKKRMEHHHVKQNKDAGLHFASPE